MLCIGPGGNGKTTEILTVLLEDYFRSGSKFSYIRRRDIEIEPERMRRVFPEINARGIIKDLSGGTWDGVDYQRGAFRLFRTEEGKRKPTFSQDTIGYLHTIAGAGYDKGGAVPDVLNIYFDEFMSESGYMPDEFYKFIRLIKTIVRNRDKTKIFMTGNTVNNTSPYFVEMGLSNIKSMKPGELQIYSYGKHKLKVAVEMPLQSIKTKAVNDTFFAFNNPKLQVVHGESDTFWAFNLFPHCPVKFEKTDIKGRIFIKYQGEILQGDLIYKKYYFLYFHKRSYPIRHEEKEIIFVSNPDINPLHISSLRTSTIRAAAIFRKFWQEDKIFYQDNDVGNTVSNYLIEAGIPRRH